MASSVAASETKQAAIDLESQTELSRNITLTAAQFEKLYLSSGQRPIGDLNRRFANPTPLGVVCFCIPLTAFSCFLLNVHNTNQSSVATIVGAFYFLGGIGQILVGLLEFFIGNTYPFVVFTSFAGLYLSFGFINDIQYDLVAAFGGATQAAADPAYTAGIATYLAVWTAMLAIYCVVSIRTNATFFLLLILITPSLACLSAAYFKLSNADVASAQTLLKACGGLMMAAVIPGYYLIVVQLLEALDFKYSLPVGDFSGFLARNHKKE